MRTKEYTEGTGYYFIMCPACKVHHTIWTKEKERPNWKFNGDFEKPTFSPSVRIQWTDHETETKEQCHFFIVNGNIQFESDCTHELKGKTLPLIDLDVK